MNKNLSEGFVRSKQYRKVFIAIAVVTLFSASFSPIAKAQDQDQDDPPGRVARLGHLDGSVSFQPAGESEWVEAVSNRPMTTGDKVWADRDSRAEVQLGSSTINLAANTGFSFLNLDDRTVQIQLSAGTINVRVYELDRDTDYEIDTPNQAFVIEQPLLTVSLPPMPPPPAVPPNENVPPAVPPLPPPPPMLCATMPAE